MKLCVCKCCGREIDGEFLYCPWCGESRLLPVERGSMEAVFAQQEHMHVRQKEACIEQLKGKLDELDRELSCLALSVEMHR
ncbi:MAG: hypothetical protein J1D88_04310 [Treponema sp.]|nr:hypothetical protein [Treponema sp.]